MVIVEFPGNTYLYSYTNRKTDRQTGGQTDEQVNKLKDFFGQGGGCGYGVDGKVTKLTIGR